MMTTTVKISDPVPQTSNRMEFKRRYDNDQIMYRIFLKQDDDGRFVATCPDLQGVVTDGATEEEAMENARYAVADMVDALGITNKKINLSRIISV